MKGSAGVPVLQLETLNKVIQMLPAAPSLFWTNMFPSSNYESDAIKWEIEYGSAGLTPFVAPGAPAPTIGLDGVGEGNAKAAFYKEKMYFDEVFLNNIRQVGTDQYETAERKLAKGLQKLRSRCDRRTEWMMAKAIINGAFSYTAVGGVQFTVNYGIPSTHLVTLTGNNVWLTGSTRNPISDIATGKQVLADDAGVQVTKAICNSALLRGLMLDANIQALLKKDAFGEGNLFVNTAQVVGSLLGVGNLVVYDDFHEVEQMLTGAVTGGATTTIPVADTTDIEVGSIARFIDVSEPNVWEDEVVASVDHAASTFTVSAAPTLGFKGQEDVVRIRKKFLADNEFLLMSEKNADGNPIAEYMKAPFGLQRTWGLKVDTHEEWDPEGLWIRVQNKGLPVIYHPDCIYKLTVY